MARTRKRSLSPLARAQPLRITLRGVTNCATDPSADSWQAASCALLRRVCGASGEGADAPSLTLLRRGLPSAGGGEVLLRVPALRSLSRLRLSDPGLVKRVRGVAFTERVTPQAANRLVDAARGLLNRLIPDVYIFTDHRSGAGAGAAPGFGLSLFAETTTGCVLAADGVADAPPPSARGGGGGGDAEAGGDAAAPWRGEGLAGGTADTPEGLGLRVAAALLAEVRRGGCVDAGHDAIALLLALAGPEQVATLRLGRLGGAAVRALRDARGFAGATFALEARRGAEEDSGGGDTVLCSCVGLGRPNTGRAVA